MKRVVLAVICPACGERAFLGPHRSDGGGFGLFGGVCRCGRGMELRVEKEPANVPRKRP